MRKIPLLGFIFLGLLGCSDFYPAFTSQGHPRIPPPTHWNRSDTLDPISLTLEPKSQLRLILEVDTTVPAQEIHLWEGEQTMLRWDSLVRDTTLLLDSTTTQSQELEYRFRLEYRVTEEQAPPLFQTFHLQIARTWVLHRAQIATPGFQLNQEIPVEPGDSIRIALDCMGKPCSGVLQDGAGNELWSKTDYRFYRHRFDEADTVAYRFANFSNENLTYQDTVVIYRTIPVQ